MGRSHSQSASCIEDTEVDGGVFSFGVHLRLFLFSKVCLHLIFFVPLECHIIAKFPIYKIYHVYTFILDAYSLFSLTNGL